MTLPFLDRWNSRWLSGRTGASGDGHRQSPLQIRLGSPLPCERRELPATKSKQQERHRLPRQGRARLAVTTSWAWARTEDPNGFSASARLAQFRRDARISTNHGENSARQTRPYSRSSEQGDARIQRRG